jgi:hypothetical protein
MMKKVNIFKLQDKQETELCISIVRCYETVVWNRDTLSHARSQQEDTRLRNHNDRMRRIYTNSKSLLRISRVVPYN